MIMFRRLYFFALLICSLSASFLSNGQDAADSSKTENFVPFYAFKDDLLNKLDFEELRVHVDRFKGGLFRDQDLLILGNYISKRSDFSSLLGFKDNKGLFPIPKTGISSNINLDLLIGTENFFFNSLRSFNWGYGPRWGRMHRGLDLGLETGDTIRSTFNGIVRYAEFNNGGYGNCVIISHMNGLETLYGHLSKISCKSGSFVFAGQVIGLGGSTGRSTGPHLHLEFRYLGQSIDPLHLVDSTSWKLKSNRFVLLPSHMKDPDRYIIQKTSQVYKVSKGKNKKSKRKKSSKSSRRKRK